MRTRQYWEEFAEATVTRLMRPDPGDPLLIITDTANDMNLAEAYLAAAIRAGADAQLLVQNRPVRGAAPDPRPIVSEAIFASKLILDFGDAIDKYPATLEARKKGTRVLATDVRGVEEYVVRALLDVDVEAMIRNTDRVAELWNKTKHCRVTSPQGTGVTFELMPRKCAIGYGALTQDGDMAFYPGSQVSIAPIEETINGIIVIDASDSVQGVVHTPYSFTLEKGVVTAIEGGKEADVIRNWFEKCDEKIYRLCHFSIGMNPQAGISGNMIEDERMLTAVDFGFGYQDPKFGGTIGWSPYHEDIMLVTPTIYLDGKEMSGSGKLNPEMGFEEM